MKLITDELFAKLVKVLAQDEKVAAFQQLLLAPTAEKGEKPGEVTTEAKE